MYFEVAPLVGLNPVMNLRDIGTFQIHQSRIPTDLFKSIVTDMDMMLMWYSPPGYHLTEEVKSGFFSPVQII